MTTIDVSANSNYLTLMMPLSSGQSQQVMVEVCNPVTMCKQCYNTASVMLSDKRKVRVGECPDCAIETMFSNSFGCIIPENMDIDEFIKNPAKYELTPTHWLTAYVDDTLHTTYLNRSHNEHKLREAIDALFDIASEPTYSQTTSPKLISRVRRKTDLTDEMDNLMIDDSYEDDDMILITKRMRYNVDMRWC